MKSKVLEIINQMKTYADSTQECINNGDFFECADENDLVSAIQAYADALEAIVNDTNN